MNALTDVVSAEFQKRFRKASSIFISPGRINLIGEHVDYNEGWVMPAAIDKHFVFAIAPNDTERCTAFALDFKDNISFSTHELKTGSAWTNYFMGVVDGILKSGRQVGGFDCVFSSNIPAGAGLSSSAALCCGLGFSLNKTFSLNLSRLDLAKIAQRAEHIFAGVKCGIMDQYACLFGESNMALLLDCKSLTHEPIPLNLPSHTIILADTKVKHALASTEYNDRREACEQAIGIIAKKIPSVRSLREVKMSTLLQFQDALGIDIFSRCRFVVEEMSRTNQGANMLRKGYILSFGKLMNDTHWGLSKLYEVSCEELDTLVTIAEENREIVAGSRMMGGGFGGCTINLVSRNQVGIFKEKVRDGYYEAFRAEPDFYEVSPSQGVNEVKE